MKVIGDESNWRRGRSQRPGVIQDYLGANGLQGLVLDIANWIGIK